MRFKIHVLPPLAACCLGGLVSLLLVTILLVPSSRTFNHEMLTNYGNALSSMAARQAVDATFNHDLVRLQVILQDVIDNPLARFATIHDVENKLLVQAGNHATTGDILTFTSPIILHDSVAGYVAVSLDAASSDLGSSLILITAIAMLLVAITAWSLYQHQALEIRFAAAPSSGQNKALQSQQIVEEQETTNTVDASRDLVFAVIHIKNLNVLQQQLNGPAFRDTIARMEKLIADVMALYGGHQYELIDNYYILSFQSADNRGEALFHAICSAYLILELGGILNKVPFDLAALVSADEKDLVPEKLPFAGLIVEITAGNEELINRRVEFMELGTEDGKRVLSGFRQPFQTLLDNQHKQLSQLF